MAAWEAMAPVQHLVWFDDNIRWFVVLPLAAESAKQNLLRSRLSSAAPARFSTLVPEFHQLRFRGTASYCSKRFGVGTDRSRSPVTKRRRRSG